MRAEDWVIDFAFPYPNGCTREQLRRRLASLAAHWPGWDRYPWRITRNIHRFIDSPPVNFHYLLVQRCVAAHAAHLVLHGTCEDRDEVLDMMVREEFQFIGVFRQMLIDALRYEIKFTKLPYIRDCTGTDEGHRNVSEAELQERRRGFREAIEGAERDFVRILNVASMTESMDEWVNGHPLRVWARGGDLPEPVRLQVRIEERDGKRVILPRKPEAAAMMKAGKTVPRLEVQGDDEEAAGGSGQGAGREERKTERRNGKGAARRAGRGGETEDGKAERNGRGLERGGHVADGEYKRVRMANGRVIDLRTKHKARGVLRFIVERARRTGEREFNCETVREAYNAQFPESMKSKRWVCERFRDDLFKGKEREFDLLFETIDRALNEYRLKI